MKKYLLLFAYILSTLACGLTAPAPVAPAAVAVTVTVNAPAVKHVAPAAITTTSTPITPAVNTGFPVMVAVGDVNVRAAPSTDSDVVGWLLEGQGIEVFAIVGGWAQVKDGYIKAEWLK